MWLMAYGLCLKTIFSACKRTIVVVVTYATNDGRVNLEAVHFPIQFDTKSHQAALLTTDEPVFLR